MQTLAWSLLHFLWQGTAIAAIAAAAMVVLRNPATRYLVGITALVLMLASFVITFAAISAPAATVAEAAIGAPAAAPASAREATAYSANNLMEERAAVSSSGDFAWIARGWLIGVFVFALRMAFGLLVLEHLRRRNLIALPDALVERFRALQQRLGIRRVIRYCECHSLSVPAVIGFFRPIVLLPMRALTGLTPEQLEAVIAHELGHIKRFDVAVNFFQVIAETLFFFHPAVWWLNKRIRADREDCCDDVAITACGGTVGYARALATMETWRAVPSFAMAATGSPVAARVMRLLGVSQQQNGARTAGVVTASLVLATALIAAGVSLGITNPAVAQVRGGSYQQLVVQEVATQGAQEFAQELAQEVTQEFEQIEQVQQVEEFQQTEPATSGEPKAPRAPKPRAPATAPAPPNAPNPKSPPSTTSYINELNAAGIKSVDVDQLIAMRVHDVTPEYVREMRGAGLEAPVPVLISMKIHDITPAYAAEIRSLGFKPAPQDLVAMKIHDVTPQYVKGLRELGIDADAHEIIALKTHDISPQYVKQMRAAGFNPATHELIAMKIQDITPEFRQAFEAAGYKLTVSELIQAKVMDVTPDFIRKADAQGFRNLPFHKLIQLKNADVF
jgi:beta-lactamase regulating signal transducer with metallopeptidase domain